MVCIYGSGQPYLLVANIRPSAREMSTYVHWRSTFRHTHVYLIASCPCVYCVQLCSLAFYIQTHACIPECLMSVCVLCPGSTISVATMGPSTVNDSTGVVTCVIFYGVQFQGATLLKWANDQGYQGTMEVRPFGRADTCARVFVCVCVQQLFVCIWVLVHVQPSFVCSNMCIMLCALCVLCMHVCVCYVLMCTTIHACDCICQLEYGVAHQQKSSGQ